MDGTLRDTSKEVSGVLGQPFVRAAPVPDDTSKEVSGVLRTRGKVSADVSNWGSIPSPLTGPPVPTY